MTRWSRTSIALGAVALAAGCAGGAATNAPSSTPVAQAIAALEALGGSGVSGAATFTVENGAVVLELALAGAAPGEHAVHLHEFGDCSAADGSSAGAHWNPTTAAHGRWGAGAFHLGDIGNVVVGAGGRGTLRLVSEHWALRTGAANDVLGKSVIVHAKVDDFTTQPTGNAGGRIACGVVR